MMANNDEQRVRDQFDRSGRGRYLKHMTLEQRYTVLTSPPNFLIVLAVPHIQSLLNFCRLNTHYTIENLGRLNAH